MRQMGFKVRDLGIEDSGNWERIEMSWNQWGKIYTEREREREYVCMCVLCGWVKNVEGEIISRGQREREREA